MRRILIDNARRKRSRKGGGGLIRHDLDNLEASLAEPADDLLALDEALNKLATADKTVAELVRLRFFAGLPPNPNRLRSEHAGGYAAELPQNVLEIVSSDHFVIDVDDHERQPWKFLKVVRLCACYPFGVALTNGLDRFFHRRFRIPFEVLRLLKLRQEGFRIHPISS
jgi:hypothetical protein